MKYFKYIAIILIGNVIISCGDFLEPAPSSAITSSNYYSTTDEVESALLGVYNAIQGVNSSNLDFNHGVQFEFYITEMRSDNTSTRTPDGEDVSDAGQFENFNVLPTNSFVGDYYSSFYEVIFRANVVLENLGVIEDTDKRTTIEAEAKFLRGYAYFNLVRLFGDIPLIDRVITPSETDIQFTRVNTSLIYQLIVSDLSAAVSGLDNTYRTRASKAAAQGLLAKVYLTLDTPEYGLAQNLCEEIIMNTPKYSLESNLNSVFYTETNSEVIFAIGYQSGVQNNSQLFSSEWLNAVGRTSGVNYVTLDAKAAIDAFGGDRIADTYRVDPIDINRFQVAKYFPDGDGGGNDGRTFATDATKAGNDWVVLRYSDVLLMHVEAILAGAAETSFGDALTSFQKVQDRAFPATAPNVKAKVTKQELLDERRVELAFENHRIFDLIRLGEAETVLSAYSTANGFGYTSTDLLLPIPQNEINLSKGKMGQNPGYN